jgi:PncC family amidohydrolase
MGMTNAKMLSIISQYMIGARETIAIAESVTAGLIMSNFSSAENASHFFQGGITTYNLGQKTRQLNIDPIHADATNCVSERISQQMACQVSTLFCSQWGISITGYATPLPALKIKSCFAICSFAYNQNAVFTYRMDTKLSGQDKVKNYFAKNVIRAFVKHLDNLK